MSSTRHKTDKLRFVSIEHIDLPSLDAACVLACSFDFFRFLIFESMHFNLQRYYDTQQKIIF